MKIEGKDIFVEAIAGEGDLSFLLIHNAGSDHRFFTHQVEMLKSYGNVIWLDLPGHGKSQPISRYTMHDLSSLIVNICKAQDLKNICLVGLNNGANIAIDAVVKQGLNIQKLILIDPPIFLDLSFIKEIKSYIESLTKAQFDSAYVQSFVQSLFIDTNVKNKEIAAQAFNAVNKNALAEIFKGLLEWDTRSHGILKNITCPTLCILTDEHHCSFEKMKNEAPQFEIGKVVGSKCWATLEVPEQVNAMIARFLKIRSLQA